MALRIKRLCWVGVRTPEYEQMVRFLRDVMGLSVEFEEATTAELSLPSGDRIRLFGPGDRYYDFFGQHAAGPVPLFEVEARLELEQAGIMTIGETESDDKWEWVHFRGPDGNLCELASLRH